MDLFRFVDLDKSNPNASCVYINPEHVTALLPQNDLCCAVFTVGRDLPFYVPGPVDEVSARLRGALQPFVWDTHG